MDGPEDTLAPRSVCVDGRMREDASEREEVGISNAAAIMLRSLYIISLFVRPRANGATEKRRDGKTKQTVAEWSQRWGAEMVRSTLV